MIRLALPLLSCLVLLISGCGDYEDQDEYVDGQYGYTDQEQTDPDDQGQNGSVQNAGVNGEKVAMLPNVDAQTGMISYWSPYPASWKATHATQPSEPGVTGPDGVKVYSWKGGSFIYSNDPFTQQMYQRAGEPMRPPVDISTYVQQDIAQMMGSKGMRLVKQYPLPQVASMNQAYMSKLFKAAPAREHHSAMGTEWADAKGEQMFVVVNMIVNETQSFVSWFTFMQVLTAEKRAMSSARAALINGIVNTKYNPKYIAAFNADQQRKSNQSWAQHNAQMQQNQQNFDRQQAAHRNSVQQWQQSHRETQDHINNNMMSSYNNRMQTNDEIQRMESNYLNDENTVRNTNTGERYQVESGADQYWMNNNNEYIKSNDALYNPNLDQNVWDQQWQETEIEP